MALPGLWACPALEAGAPKYWPGASALSPDPVPGEGVMVELRDVVPGHATRIRRPRPIEGGVSICSALDPLIPLPSPLIPLPGWGET